MTATATIQVAYVNQPDPPKRKNGSIKTTTGESYTVKPVELGQFQEGRFYEIEYSEYTFKGYKGRSIERSKPHTPDRPSVVNSAGSVSAPVADGSQVTDHKSPRTIPISDGAESYFVTHILAAKIASCHIGREDNLVAHIAALREAYRRGFA